MVRDGQREINEGIERVSRPGSRNYVGKAGIPRVQGGLEDADSGSAG